MTEKEFLRTTLRQLLILEDLHSNYIQGNLMQVANSILGEQEAVEEDKYVESFSALF
ncbi:hypothetical protein SDC9_180918 [bioreactor metagenome]|uniref:Uncharacterized protein n=1 Tax=bioreactor metagenome TaxID=1076179 RepID=A0A645H321_9ZZZZ